MLYYKFMETNEWEGESWNFYVPMSKEHRDMIASVIESNDDFDSPYIISTTMFTEEQVNDRVSKSKMGYYRYHNKCEPLDEDFIAIMEDGQINLLEEDPFYKGKCWKRVKTNA